MARSMHVVCVDLSPFELPLKLLASCDDPAAVHFPTLGRVDPFVSCRVQMPLPLEIALFLVKYAPDLC